MIRKNTNRDENNGGNWEGESGRRKVTKRTVKQKTEENNGRNYQKRTTEEESNRGDWEVENGRRKVTKGIVKQKSVEESKRGDRGEENGTGK